MQAETKDAFGNLIHEPPASQMFGVEKDAFGNIIYNNVLLPDQQTAQQRELAALRMNSSGDANKDAVALKEASNKMADEFEKVKKSLPPEYARLVGDINPNDTPEKIAELLGKAEGLKREEEAKKLQNEFGGAIGLATGAAFLGSVLSGDKARGEKSDGTPDSPNKNDRFEKLLSALGGEDRKLFGALGGGKNVSEGELLSVQNNLPDLMAASRNVDVRSV